MPDQRCWELSASPLGEYTVVRGPALGEGERVPVVEAVDLLDEDPLESLRRLEDEAVTLEARRDLLIGLALAAGHSEREVGAAAGVSGPAINQWKRRHPGERRRFRSGEGGGEDDGE